ncbi:hypothetical protein EW146_g2183 [Bondarzewia mesenterica]|uniref:REJ domain-containing protein n=1 Tax=Bondarzewia mesenterica TaxID=1095465 RepID=A0A4S4M1I9_9AGAM|nr:hypothetical protein EW146_g2183 [Bondarzewia mesenterica]
MFINIHIFLSISLLSTTVLPSSNAEPVMTTDLEVAGTATEYPQYATGTITLSAGPPESSAKVGYGGTSFFTFYTVNGGGSGGSGWGASNFPPASLPVPLSGSTPSSSATLSLTTAAFVSMPNPSVSTSSEIISSTSPSAALDTASSNPSSTSTTNVNQPSSSASALSSTNGARSTSAPTAPLFFIAVFSATGLVFAL